jgi:hypothetical protein
MRPRGRVALTGAAPGRAAADGDLLFTLLDGRSHAPLPDAAVSRWAADAPRSGYDVVVCFDVLVHCDLHVHWRYLQEVRAGGQQAVEAVQS